MTGAQPHLGTFYGWLRPVAAAADDMDVIVLVSDLQSLDVPRDHPAQEQAVELAGTLRRFLPHEVPVVIESRVPSLAALAFLAAPLFARHHWQRIAPLRKLTRAGQSFMVGTLLYPAMMIANVHAFAATHVLAKPEGRFQHADVLNDVLKRAASRYGWPRLHLQVHPKPRVDIRSADGSGPMKRTRPGFVTVDDATPGSIAEWASSVTTPADGASGPARQRACTVVWPIWQARAAGQPPSSAASQDAWGIGAGCTSAALSCHTCTEQLSHAVADDVTAARVDHVEPRPADHHVEEAERRAQHLIRIATGQASGADGGPASGRLSSAGTPTRGGRSTM